MNTSDGGRSLERAMLNYILGCWLIFATDHIQAAEWNGATGQELKTMPAYCAAKLIKNHPKRKYWQQRLGKTFGSVHHYCNALAFYRRAQNAMDNNPRRTNLKFALDDFNYMLQHPSAENPIISDIYFHRGKTYYDNGQYRLAMQDYVNALKYKPDYAMAYLELAKLYAKNNMQEDALKVIEMGLQQIPGNRVLKRRLYKYQSMQENEIAPSQE